MGTNTPTKPTWLTPCHRRAEIFTNPQPGGENTAQAKALCGRCPIIKDCAEAALHAGDSLDGNYTRPATGVIQAGVYCTGDQWTATQLAAIAGVEVPTYHDHIQRNHHGGECKGCGRPMGSWSRNQKNLMPGHVMHYARGFCTDCRGDYKTAVVKAAVEHERPWGKPRGIVCRKRETAGDQADGNAAGPQPETAAQLSIF